MRAFQLTFLLLLLSWTVVSEEISITPGSLTILGSSSIFGVEDSPIKWYKDSFVEVNLILMPNVVNPNSENLGVVASRQPNLQVQIADYRVVSELASSDFCCRSTSSDPYCASKPYGISIPDHLKSRYFYQVEDVPVAQNPPFKTVPHITTFVPLQRTGFYAAAVINCDPASYIITGAPLSLDPPYFSFTVVHSTIKFMGATGYLPAVLFGYIPLFSVMLVAYLVVVLVFLIPIAIYKPTLLRIHYMFIIVLQVALGESLSCHVDLVNFNSTAKPFVPASLMCLASRVAVRSLSRPVIVFLAIGYGVFLQNIGNRLYILGPATALFTIVLFVRETILRSTGGITPYMAELSTRSYAPTAVIAANILCACFETFFAMYTYIGLQGSVHILKQTQRKTTLQLYLNFQKMLYFMVGVCLCYITYLIVSKLNNFAGENELWGIHWILHHGFNDLSYLFLLVSIMVLWRPSKVSHRANYAEQSSTANGQFEFDEMSLDVLEGGDQTALKELSMGNTIDDSAHTDIEILPPRTGNHESEELEEF